MATTADACEPLWPAKFRLNGQHLESASVDVLRLPVIGVTHVGSEHL